MDCYQRNNQIMSNVPFFIHCLRYVPKLPSLRFVPKLPFKVSLEVGLCRAAVATLSLEYRVLLIYFSDHKRDTDISSQA